MLYLAYGSNMLGARLLARVPSAGVRGAAAIAGREVRFHKRGWLDGSGKADLVPVERPGAVAHGVVYEIAAQQRELLDRAEGLGRGYRHEAVTVTVAGQSIEAFTYRGEPGAIDPQLRPFSWYLELVVAGARENRLPAAYIRRLGAVETIEDADRGRAELHRRLLGSGAEQAARDTRTARTRG